MENVATNQSGPVRKQARIQSIDTLRGVALFGILLLNIIAFALPLGSYSSPIVDGATEGIDLFTYMAVDTFFEGSMRTIFSMLFGAGVLLFTAKPDTGSIPVADLYFRRTILLIAFGVVDGYLLLWVGDILYFYGMAGLFLFVFRNSSPMRLMSYGMAIIIFFAVMHSIESVELRQLRSEVLAVEALPESSLDADQRAKLEEWETFRADNREMQETADEDISLRKSGYLDIVVGQAPIILNWQTTTFYLHYLWDVIAMMLLGMAFMKWGVFDASRSMRFYTGMAVTGMVVGTAVNYYEVHAFVESGFATHLNVSSYRPTYDIGRFFMAIGYIGLVMIICKAGILRWLRSALAAVGQMALTNYLSHAIICNTLFMGFGFGLYGDLQRHQIYYVVFAIWIFQLITSPLWLRHFRFGPVEWLWRSMTYGEKQPLRINRTADN